MSSILKILKPNVIKNIMKYVFEENNLDFQMGSIRARLKKLEKVSHPRRDFVVCEKCKCEVEEKKGKWYDK